MASGKFEQTAAPVLSERSLLSRIANVLALIAVKGEKQEQQIQTLRSAGFQNIEIAELLGTTPGTVAQTLYAQKKTAGKKRKKGRG